MIQILSQEAKKAAKRATRYPHHYATAGVLTVITFVIGGHWVEVVCFWMYALSENYVEDTDAAIARACNWVLSINPEEEVRIIFQQWPAARRSGRSFGYIIHERR